LKCQEKNVFCSANIEILDTLNLKRGELSDGDAGVVEYL